MGSAPLATLVYTVPFFLLDVMGLTYAIVEWKRHPRLSALVIGALGLSLARIVLLNLIFPSWYAAGGFLGTAASAAGTLAGLLTYGLLLFAAFFGFREGAKVAGTAGGAAGPPAEPSQET